MRKRIRSLITLFTAIVVALIIPFTTYAYNRLGTGKISGGASGLLFYIDSSAYEYRHSIMYGIQYWNNHISTVSVYQTTNKPSSRCDNYWGSYFPATSNTIAQTQLILNNQVTYNYNVDWYWCKILYNENIYKYEDGQGNGLSYFNRKGTACHEYGHFLGLAHTSSTACIMCQLSAGRTAGQPASDDINGISAIYGT